MQRGEAAGLAYRELLPASGAEDAPTALLLHGYPESSYIWRNVMPAVAAAGWRALAPDLAGFGDSPPDLPGTWERHVEAVERSRGSLGLGPVALVAHDWGGLIGLRWACDATDSVSALVVSNTGFFPDGRWHGFAQTLRTPGEGEQTVAALTRELLAQVLRGASPGITDDVVDEFWKCFGDPDRRQAQLDLYRSGDFEKLEPYRGRLAALGVPTLVLWGERDEFAPVAGAHRFAREIPGARVVVLDGAGHFAQEDQPERYAEEIGRFLTGVAAQ